MDTVTLPVPAPIGTVAVICVADAVVAVAAFPLKNTLSFPVFELKPVPVIVTLVLYGPVVELRETMVAALFCGVGLEPLFEQAEKRKITSIKIPDCDKGFSFIIM